MSKYIKTENRIYQVESILRDNGFVKGYNVGEMAFIRNGQVIGKANTIEELCDEFVVVFEDKNHIVYSQFKWAMDKAMWSFMPFVIYGAIWTDKGLIYVAKLNDKGDLELL